MKQKRSWINEITMWWVVRMVREKYSPEEIGESSEFYERFMNEMAKHRGNGRLILIECLVKTFPRSLFTLIFTGLAFSIGQVLQPFLLTYILTHITHSFFSFILLSACLCGMVIAQSHLSYIYVNIGHNMASCLRVCLYEAALNSGSDNIMDLFVADARRMYMVGPHLLTVLFGPWVVGGVIWFLGAQVGWLFVVVVVALVVVSVLNYFIGDRINKHSHLLDEQQRSRMSLSQRITHQMEYIKAQNLQPRFEQSLHRLRQQELATHSTIYLLNLFSQILSSAIVPVSILTIFAYMQYFSLALPMETVSGVMVGISTLEGVLKAVPGALQDVIQMWVSLGRIHHFLQRTNKKSQVSINRSQFAVQVEDGKFRYGDGEWVIKDVDMRIGKNRLTAVVGPVGCGKSTLIKAILGEVEPGSNSRLTVDGSVAYVGQDAWVLSDTIKNNVTLFAHFDQHRVRQCLMGSGLQVDKVGGLQREVKVGRQLSGGERTRLCIARALYSNSSIFLLDEPFSNLDRHTCQFLLSETFAQILSQSSIIMASKNMERMKLSHLPCQTIVMEQGRVLTHVKHELGQSKESLTNIQASPSFSEDQPPQCSNQQQQGKRVRFHTFREYMIGGSCMLIVVCLILWLMGSVWATILLTNWIQSPSISSFSLYASAVIASLLLLGVRGYFIAQWGVSKSHELYQFMLKQLLYGKLGVKGLSTGVVMRRITTDIKQIDACIPNAFSYFFLSVLVMLGNTFVWIYASGGWILPLMVGLGIVGYQLGRFSLKGRRVCMGREEQEEGRALQFVQSSLQGTAYIRTYHANSNFLQQLITRLHAHTHARLLREALECWLSLHLGLIAAAVTIAAIAWALIHQQISTLTVLFTCSTSICAGVVDVFMSYVELQGSMLSVERMLQFASIPPEDDGYHILPSLLTQASLNINHLEHTYANGKTALKDISIKIESGQRVGVVGKSGSGKSTFMKCLLRLVDIPEKTIYIEGKDVTEYGVDWLRRNITYIHQQPTFIPATIMDNLNPHKQPHSPSHVEKVMKECGLDSLIAAKGGFTANIEACQFSAGEAQLLCLGAALLRPTALLLMDEPTSCLNHEQQKQVDDLLDKYFSNATIIMIAHQLHTMNKCDKILVLEDGELKQWGSRAQLLGIKGGRYKKMCEGNTVD